MQTINITISCPYDNGPQNNVPCVGQVDFVQVCSIANIHGCNSCVKVDLVSSNDGMHIKI